MQEVIFPYYVNCGGGDSVDAEINVKLSEKDYKRLVKSAHAMPRWRLYEDEALDDIYKKVYASIVKHHKAEFEEDPEFAEDMLDDYEEGMKITTEMVEEYLDQYEIGINYPEDLQDLGESEDDEDDE